VRRRITTPEQGQRFDADRAALASSEGVFAAKRVLSNAWKEVVLQGPTTVMTYVFAPHTMAT
jgi:hypothetical protein